MGLLSPPRRLCFWFGLLVCLSAGLQENHWPDFHELDGRLKRGPGTNLFNFGLDPNHGADKQIILHFCLHCKLGHGFGLHSPSALLITTFININIQLN